MGDGFLRHATEPNAVLGAYADGMIGYWVVDDIAPEECRSRIEEEAERHGGDHLLRREARHPSDRDDRSRLATYPAHTAIHLILDNHSAHVSRETRAWLAEQPTGRFEFTFTPKHGSWLNLVEGSSRSSPVQFCATSASPPNRSSRTASWPPWTTSTTIRSFTRVASPRNLRPHAIKYLVMRCHTPTRDETLPV